MNSSIIPKDVNVWHWKYNYYFWCQNNDTTAAIMTEISTSEVDQQRFSKDAIKNSWGPSDFVPIIEYIE